MSVRWNDDNPTPLPAWLLLTATAVMVGSLLVLLLLVGQDVLCHLDAARSYCGGAR